MTCPRCGFGNHPVAECPERLEEHYGVPSDNFDEEDESDHVSLRDGETRDDSNSHAARNAAQLAMAEDTEDNDE